MSQKLTLSELRTFIQERAIKLVESKLREEREIIKEGIEDVERDMMIASDDDGRISNTELQDIAIEHGVDMDDEAFLKIYSNVRNRLLKLKDENLKEDIQYTIDSYFDGSAPDSFKEFYDVFSSQNFDNVYSQSDVFEKYKSMTINLAQLSMFETKNELEFGEKEARKKAGQNGEYTYTRKEPCTNCGSREIYVGPETGGWKSCAGCGTI